MNKPNWKITIDGAHLVLIVLIIGMTFVFVYPEEKNVFDYNTCVHTCDVSGLWEKVRYDPECIKECNEVAKYQKKEGLI